MKRIMLLCLIFLLLPCICYGDSAGPQVGDKAPAIKAKEWVTSKGILESAKVAKITKGKIIVVEFWATWCPPCKKSTPHLVELYSKYKNKGVIIIGITREDRRQAKIDSFIREMRVNYIIGTGSSTSERYGVRSIPHAFLINPNGQIIWMGHPMSGLDKAIKDAVEKYPEAAN